MNRQGRWVLVVDDDDDIREIVGIVLAQCGFGTEGAADGEAALVHLRGDEPPALVLLDLMMPRVSGADVLKAMTTDPSLATVPVIVMSGDRSAGATAEALGAKGILTKPMDLDDLVNTVRRFAIPIEPTSGAGLVG